MSARKIFGKFHRWLGLTSGLVVFIVAITGCLYAFQEEIQDLTQPFRFVEKQDAPFLPPSQLMEIANAEMPGKHIHGIMYYKEERAAQAIYWAYEDYYDLVYLNPYTGEILEIFDINGSFFGWVLAGHFNLWLPKDIGEPLVSWFTVIFVIMLISGLVLWWPRNKQGRKQRFKIKWDAQWKRKNYDLHQVIGFYLLSLGLIFALTGLVWGFDWFRDGLYTVVSGGETYHEYEEPQSDTMKIAMAGNNPIDLVWQKMIEEYPDAASIEVHPPETEHSSIAANANPEHGTYYKIDYRYFDQYTLEELPVDHIWGRTAEASAADQLFRMNYDIHVGAILGFPGKLLAFLVSLLIATLPVTGFLIWYGRNKKNKRAAKESLVKKATPEMEEAA